MMPPSFFLLTAFGKDRPGIVAEVTRAVFQAGGNIDDASMTRLGGEFTMMLVVGLPNSAAGARFQKTLASLQKKARLSFNIKPVTANLAHSKRPAQATHLISVYGTDRPGIVYKAAEVASRLHINITDLNTRTLQRSLPAGRQAGKPLYLMLLEVQIPSRSKAAALKKRLQSLGRSLKLDVTLQDIDPISL